MNANSNQNIMLPSSLMNSTQKLQAATQPAKSLTIKHKQLAKAIKHHHAMVRQTDGGILHSGPMTTKANHHTENELRSDKPIFIIKSELHTSNTEWGVVRGRGVGG